MITQLLGYGQVRGKTRSTHPVREAAEAFASRIAEGIGSFILDRDDVADTARWKLVRKRSTSCEGP